MIVEVIVVIVLVAATVGIAGFFFFDKDDEEKHAVISDEDCSRTKIKRSSGDYSSDISDVGGYGMKNWRDKLIDEPERKKVSLLVYNSDNGKWKCDYCDVENYSRDNVCVVCRNVKGR